MFPRVVLHDARGTFVSLSHFCPTAASLLFEDHGEVTIVEAPAALAAIGELDGLDAREEWPPLLRPGVLMDMDSYGAWEAHAVALLASGGAPARETLAMLDAITARITGWTPDAGPLLERVHRAFPACLPSPSSDAPIKRWLAARLFAAWSAYQGDGLAFTLRYLRTCLLTFEDEFAADENALEAIRRSDLRILHTAGPERSGLHQR